MGPYMQLGMKYWRHISWCLFVNNWNHNIGYFKPSASDRCPTSHQPSPLSLPLPGKELNTTATLTNSYKKNFNTSTPLSSEMAITTTSWCWRYTHNPQTQQPYLKITPHKLPFVPHTIHLLTIYSENCNQNIIKCNIISLYKKTTTPSNIFYNGDLLY